MGIQIKSNIIGLYFNKLVDGQLAEIVDSYTDEDIGKVGMRWGKKFILIGEPGREHYEDLPEDTQTLRLRILTDGEILIVRDNEY